MDLGVGCLVRIVNSVSGFGFSGKGFGFTISLTLGFLVRIVYLESARVWRYFLSSSIGSWVWCLVFGGVGF